MPRPIGGRTLPERPPAGAVRRQTWIAFGASAATAVALLAVALYLLLGRRDGVSQPLASVNASAPSGLAATGGADSFLFLGAGDGCSGRQHDQHHHRHD